VQGAWHTDDLPIADDPRPTRSPPSQRPLTERELDVLRYLPTRLSTTDIAVRLRISPNTVKTHLKNIYHKLGARSRNEAIIRAAQQRLISDDSAAGLVDQLRGDGPELATR
jgi:DNA-binding CsgD family transcriptional regulator